MLVWFGLVWKLPFGVVCRQNDWITTWKWESWSGSYLTLVRFIFGEWKQSWQTIGLCDSKKDFSMNLKAKLPLNYLLTMNCQRSSAIQFIFTQDHLVTIVTRMHIPMWGSSLVDQSDKQCYACVSLFIQKVSETERSLSMTYTVQLTSGLLTLIINYFSMSSLWHHRR